MQTTTTASYDSQGSHMPLDAELHWAWYNPLNIIPALLLLGMLLASARSFALV